MFMNGMYAAYIVKWIINKLHLDFLLENTLQGKITGWTADYLVVCAFMAVSVNIRLASINFGRICSDNSGYICCLFLFWTAFWGLE